MQRERWYRARNCHGLHGPGFDFRDRGTSHNFERKGAGQALEARPAPSSCGLGRYGFR